MIPDLEKTTAKEILARIIKSAGRGAGHVGAFGLAAVVGTLKWNIEDPVGLESEKPTLWKEIKTFYHAFKPYTPSLAFKSYIPPPYS